jgi:EAL domain-containing protein (putative c-di-GMP-specific phosphodiesterase class I)
MVGAETLVRWEHPEAGLVTPDRFLPYARELNLEPLNDQQVVQCVLAQSDDLRAAGVSLPKTSVNVSARRLRHPGLVAEFDTLKVPANRISLELVKSVFLDESDPHLLWTLHALRERGIDTEIDDFGTGHASIMGLLRVAPDRLKTDKGIIGSALEEQRLKRLFALIVEIGSVLGIRVTAEDVETAAHAKLAQEMGCSVLQEYHFAEPMPFATHLGTYGTNKSVG